MKKEFVFDKCETDIIDLDETTVIKDTGVSADRVKENVLMKINNDKKVKKFNAKKFFTVLGIAAAITAAATVTVQAATGAYNPIFAEWFSGESVDGVFPGKDLTVKSDTVNIDFVGVTGSETEMYAVYDITNKDGSSFVDSVDGYVFLGNYANMELSENIWKNILGGSHGSGCGVTYSFVDENTIRAFSVMSDSRGYIQGEKLTITDTEANVYHVDEVVYADENDDMIASSEYFSQHEEELEKRKTSDDQIVLVLQEGKYNEVAIVTPKSFPLDYEMSVILNYKSTSKELNTSVGKQYTSDGTTWEITELKADSFGLDLAVKTDSNETYKKYDTENMDSWDSEKIHKFMSESRESDITLEVTKADGTKVYAIYTVGSFSTESDGSGTANMRFYFMDSDNLKEAKGYTLDPSDIVSIKYDGAELMG